MTQERTLDSRPLRAAMALASLVYAWALWSTRAGAFQDFRILHLGSRMIRDGRPGDAYSRDSFQTALELDPSLPDVAGEFQIFWSTPQFAFIMRPLTYLSSDAALTVWLAIGAAAFFTAFRVLRLPWWMAVVALVLPMSLTNIQLAQTGFFALLWAAVIHRLCSEDRVAAAGMVAGFAVLKPTLLLGVAIWWLLDWRTWHRALVPAAVVGVALTIPTFVGGINVWRHFIGGLGAAEAVGGDFVANQATLKEVVNRLFGTSVAGHPVALAAYLLVGVVLMRSALRRWPHQTQILSAAAITVSVLVSPHLLIYDATLLFIPFAVAVHCGASTSSLERMVGAVVIVWCLSILPFEPFASVSRYAMPVTFALAGAGLIWARAIDEPKHLVAAERDVTRFAEADKGDIPKAA